MQNGPVSLGPPTAPFLWFQKVLVFLRVSTNFQPLCERHTPIISELRPKDPGIKLRRGGARKSKAGELGEQIELEGEAGGPRSRTKTPQKGRTPHKEADSGTREEADLGNGKVRWYVARRPARDPLTTPLGPITGSPGVRRAWPRSQGGWPRGWRSAAPSGLAPRVVKAQRTPALAGHVALIYISRSMDSSGSKSVSKLSQFHGD